MLRLPLIPDPASIRLVMQWSSMAAGKLSNVWECGMQVSIDPGRSVRLWMLYARCHCFAPHVVPLTAARNMQVLRLSNHWSAAAQMARR